MRVRAVDVWRQVAGEWNWSGMALGCCAVRNVNI